MLAKALPVKFCVIVLRRKFVALNIVIKNEQLSRNYQSTYDILNYCLHFFISLCIYVLCHVNVKFLPHNCRAHCPVLWPWIWLHDLLGPMGGHRRQIWAWNELVPWDLLSCALCDHHEKRIFWVAAAPLAWPPEGDMRCRTGPARSTGWHRTTQSSPL